MAGGGEGESGGRLALEGKVRAARLGSAIFNDWNDLSPRASHHATPLLFGRGNKCPIMNGLVRLSNVLFVLIRGSL
jgi:hypothetical protein